MKRINSQFMNHDALETASSCKCERPLKNLLCRKCGHVVRV